jgi:hypothetical protein
MKNRKGNCYVTCEALYHLLGGKKAGYKPMFMYHEDQPHWFLSCGWGKSWIDPTAKQFKTSPNWSLAKGKGFLTKHPSKKARLLMKQLLYQMGK